MNAFIRNAVIAVVTASALTPAAKADWRLYASLQKAIINRTADTESCRDIPGATVLGPPSHFYCVPPGQLIRTENGVRYLYVVPRTFNGRVSFYGIWYEVDCRTMSQREAHQFNAFSATNHIDNKVYADYRYDPVEGLMKVYWSPLKWTEMTPITIHGNRSRYGCQQWRATRF